MFDYYICECLFVRSPYFIALLQNVLSYVSRICSNFENLYFPIDKKFVIIFNGSYDKQKYWRLICEQFTSEMLV